MGELVFPGNIADLATPTHGQLLTRSIQQRVEDQFGFIPEFHRRYNKSSQCRISEYNPEAGYIRFHSFGSTEGDLAWRFFPVSGVVTEYQLLEPVTKSKVSRWAFLSKDWEGKIELGEAGVHHREAVLDTVYNINYASDGSNAPESTVVQVFFNQSRDPRVFFPYTELIYGYRYEGKPWEIYVAHGDFRQLETYYRRQRRQYTQREDEIVKPDIRDRFPGVLLKLPQTGSDVLVYEGIKGSTVIKEKPKQIDMIELGKPKIIAERGTYLYMVTADTQVYIGREGQDRQDKSFWEITFFNGGAKVFDDAIKGDWVHTKDSLATELKAKE